MPDRPPLVLTVYPTVPPEPIIGWDDRRDWDMYESFEHRGWRIEREYEADMVAAKRLTDAELAAEYWKAAERVRSWTHPAFWVQRRNAVANDDE